jgi:iron complex transport system ATP-binding protein
MKKIIEIRDAVVYRGETLVFGGLSLEVESGMSTVILGPNGAGKSTLLKLLTREVYPVQKRGSHVKVLGHGLWNVWDIRAHLGIVSQDLQQHYLYDVLGINVLLSGLYSSIGIWTHQTFTEEDRRRSRNIMEMLGVWHCRDKRYAEMSTGEQQKLLLGRALIHDPDVLVLDEPTSGLDVKTCFQYLDIIRGLMKKGRTVVLVTHHIHEIPPEISRIVLLKGGKVIGDGEKTDILTAVNLGRLFGISIELIERNGFYQVLPATPGDGKERQPD